MQYTCCGFNDPADAPVPSNCSDILNTDVGCRESLIQLSEEVLGVVKITGLVSAFVQVPPPPYRAGGSLRRR